MGFRSQIVRRLQHALVCIAILCPASFGGYDSGYEAPPTLRKATIVPRYGVQRGGKGFSDWQLWHLELRGKIRVDRSMRRLFRRNLQYLTVCQTLDKYGRNLLYFTCPQYLKAGYFKTFRDLLAFKGAPIFCCGPDLSMHCCDSEAFYSQSASTTASTPTSTSSTSSSTTRTPTSTTSAPTSTTSTPTSTSTTSAPTSTTSTPTSTTSILTLTTSTPTFTTSTSSSTTSTSTSTTSTPTSTSTTSTSTSTTSTPTSTTSTPTSTSTMSTSTSTTSTPTLTTSTPTFTTSTSSSTTSTSSSTTSTSTSTTSTSSNLKLTTSKAFVTPRKLELPKPNQTKFLTQAPFYPVANATDSAIAHLGPSTEAARGTEPSVEWMSLEDYLRKHNRHDILESLQNREGSKQLAATESPETKNPTDKNKNTEKPAGHEKPYNSTKIFLIIWISGTLFSIVAIACYGAIRWCYRMCKERKRRMPNQATTAKQKSYRPNGAPAPTAPSKPVVLSMQRTQQQQQDQTQRQPQYQPQYQPQPQPQYQQQYQQQHRHQYQPQYQPQHQPHYSHTGSQGPNLAESRYKQPTDAMPTPASAATQPWSPQPTDAMPTSTFAPTQPRDPQPANDEILTPGQGGGSESYQPKAFQRENDEDPAPRHSSSSDDSDEQPEPPAVKTENDTRSPSSDESNDNKATK